MWESRFADRAGAVASPAERSVHDKAYSQPAISRAPRDHVRFVSSISTEPSHKVSPCHQTIADAAAAAAPTTPTAASNPTFRIRLRMLTPSAPRGVRVIRVGTRGPAGPSAEGLPSVP